MQHFFNLFFPIYRNEQISETASGMNVELDEEFGEINQRKNVYDNDDFDVFKNDTVDLNKIHLGKQ